MNIDATIFIDSLQNVGTFDALPFDNTAGTYLPHNGDHHTSSYDTVPDYIGLPTGRRCCRVLAVPHLTHAFLFSHHTTATYEPQRLRRSGSI